MRVKPVTEQEFEVLNTQVFEQLKDTLKADRWADISMVPRNKVTGLYAFPVPDEIPMDAIEISTDNPEWFDQFTQEINYTITLDDNGNITIE